MQFLYHRERSRETDGYALHCGRAWKVAQPSCMIMVQAWLGANRPVVGLQVTAAQTNRVS